MDSIMKFGDLHLCYIYYTKSPTISNMGIVNRLLTKKADPFRIGFVSSVLFAYVLSDLTQLAPHLRDPVRHFQADGRICFGYHVAFCCTDPRNIVFQRDLEHLVTRSEHRCHERFATVRFSRSALFVDRAFVAKHIIDEPRDKLLVQLLSPLFPTLFSIEYHKDH